MGKHDPVVAHIEADHQVIMISLESIMTDLAYAAPSRTRQLGALREALMSVLGPGKGSVRVIRSPCSGSSRASQTARGCDDGVNDHDHGWVAVAAPAAGNPDLKFQTWVGVVP
jgi:hypothetical protein